MDSLRRWRSAPPWLCRGLTAAFLAWLALGGVAHGQSCNTPPVATPDVTDHAGRVTLFDALANDLDADGDPLSVAIVGDTCPGAVTVEDGLLLLTPDRLGVPRTCTATYRLSDGTTTRDATVSYQANELLLFTDAFETGTLGAWAECTGC